MEFGMYLAVSDEGELAEAEVYNLPDRMVGVWVDELATPSPRLDPVSFAALCAAMRAPGLSMEED